ncbi:MAG: type II secretion system protein [Candidatus Magasanikbacteria bacterium]|nr:type II secretion system protein [Candidatus Magasanikbacteria bacterium]
MLNVKINEPSLGRKGFTLIELLLYISCAAIMLTTVAVFLSFLLRTRVRSQVIAEVDGQGQQVLAIVSQLMRNATQINIPAAPGNGSTLNFVVLDGAKSPTVVNLQNGALILQEGNAPSVALTNNRVIVSGVNFKNLSRPQTSGTVQLSFTITHINPIGRNEFNYKKDFIGSASLR